MKILKFGGSSIANAQRIEKVVSIIKDYYKAKTKITVVFSAFGGVTDLLIDASKKALQRDDTYSDVFQNIKQKHLDVLDELISSKNKVKVQTQIETYFDELNNILKGISLLKELTPRISDKIMSYGEKLSNYTISEILKSNNIKAEFLDASSIVNTDSLFGNARVNFAKTNKNIKEYFSKRSKMQIVTGFIGSNDNNEITTLGRGGSDFTASIFGSALNVKEIEIWTDVDGILTADPRQVNDAVSLKAVTYKEAMEMSHFGAKVIYPPTMQPALDKKIKIRVRNTFNPSFAGTVILEKESSVRFSAKGISAVDYITLLRIGGSGLFGNEEITSRIFDVLAEYKIKTLLLTQGSSGLSICIAVLPSDGNKAKTAIEEELRLEIIDRQINKITAEENLSIIAVVGEDMHHTTGISGKVFQSMGKNGINIIAIAQGSSELNISFVIKNSELTKALNALHDSLFLAEKKMYYVFLLGAGLVGNALMKYISSKRKFLKEVHHIGLNVIGLSNSKKMVFDEDGIDIDNWKKELESSKSKSDIKRYVDEMLKMNYSNSIFVDCTASEIAIPFYNKILGSNISITTPNKIANTKKIKFYNELRKTSEKNNVKFLYSTNVGAGLPMISSLRDLVDSGKHITKIEGVLSGTLSYLFNTFVGDITFSEVVINARELGFTEPDPRDDLNGLDVSRKLLILIRELGCELELKDIKVESLVPQRARKVKSINEFFKILKNADNVFEERKAKAEKNGKVLRYIAKYENKKATVSLQEVDSSHSFYNLKLNDNIVAITTKESPNQPMVIRGNGAGADFTASGIFADILRITKYLG